MLNPHSCIWHHICFDDYLTEKSWRNHITSSVRPWNLSRCWNIRIKHQWAKLSNHCCTCLIIDLLDSCTFKKCTVANENPHANIGTYIHRCSSMATIQGPILVIQPGRGQPLLLHRSSCRRLPSKKLRPLEPCGVLWPAGMQNVSHPMRKHNMLMALYTT